MPPIYIYATSIWSCAGRGGKTLWDQLQKSSFPSFSGESPPFLGRLGKENNLTLKKLKQRNKFCTRLDRTILMALACGEELLKSEVGQCLDWQNVPIVAGSARGSIQSIENFHKDFLAKKKPNFLASPLTTPGFMASALAQELETLGGAYYLSSACLTSLHSLHLGTLLANSSMDSSAELGSGVLVIGAESCLTPYYIAQLDALGVMAKPESHSSDLGQNQIAQKYPHCAFHAERTGMVLAEGAAGVMLGSRYAPSKKPMAKILGFGFKSEPSTLTGISADGLALQKAVLDACQQAGIKPEDIDVIVAHGSGTQLGDAAEIKSYQNIFGESMPYLCTFKWLLGHTLGASSLMSAVIAAQMLQNNEVLAIPYLDQNVSPPKKIKNILLTALGFGGQAGAMVMQAV